ncbi:hypothetical protein ACIP5Y_41525 [Nocardia sp. NPDC088792]|uniref:hypothetical protein n=1 Tax=Nocardia sp. NPDC088792 TaxID=3364332 RepID=UPI003811FDF6
MSGAGADDTEDSSGASASGVARALALVRHPAVRNAGFAVAAVLVAVLIVVAGWAVPPNNGVIATDRLGPEDGVAVTDYVAHAKTTLQGNDKDQRWALVSFTAGITAEQIPGFTSGVRVSEVVFHIYIPGVATPIVTVDVPAGDAAAVDSEKAAAYQVDSLTAYDDRSSAVKKVVTSRLRADCACVVGLVVRTPLDQLRNLAAHSGVRAVEALPADASTFAVAPLLPEQQDHVGPGTDGAPVPDN